MTSGMDDHIRLVDDMVLRARIGTLAEAGRLEIRGKSALEMFDSEVRLPGQNLGDRSPA
jgi:hypothetical protein